MEKDATEIMLRATIEYVGVFFEGIGVLLHRKLIDIDSASPVSPRWSVL